MPADANTAAAEKPAEKPSAQKVITELKVSGHLMTLDAGLFCIVHTPARANDAHAGLPGVRISLPPGPASRPEMVTITSFRPDGWLHGGGDAALVRVLGGPAQILVTIYQSPTAKDAAPALQVLRLLDAAAAGAPQRPAEAQGGEMAATATAPGRVTKVMDMVAHIQERGDVGAQIGEWLGERGSKKWIEGFGISPTKDVPPKDVEYQAVLGRGWLSPWVEGGQFCGSRGMALPILGIRLRLRGESAQAYEASYSASFVDGTEVGPVAAGEACEAESLAPLEAFKIELRRRGAPAAEPPAEATHEAEPARGRRAAAAAPGRRPAPPRRR